MTEEAPPPFNRTLHEQQSQAIAAAVSAVIERGGATTVSLVGERVARVEAKIEGLEGDTTVIRSTLHTINGELQRTALHEAECAAALKQIAEQTKDLPAILGRTLAFEEMRPKIASLIDESAQRKGAWRTWALIAAAMGTCGSFSGALVAIVLHFLHSN